MDSSSSSSHNFVIDTSSDDSDDLFSDKSDVEFHPSLASSTLEPSKFKDDEEDTIPLSSLKNRPAKKFIIESDEDENSFHESGNITNQGQKENEKPIVTHIETPEKKFVNNSDENDESFHDNDSIESQEKDTSIPSSVIVQELSNEIIAVSSGSDDDDVVVQTFQPPQPSTPKLIQKKITDVLMPKTYNIQSQPSLSSLPSYNSTSFKLPVGMKFVPKADYMAQEQKIANLQQTLLHTTNALRTLDLDSLPDRGEALQARELSISEKLTEETKKLSLMLIEPKIQSASTQSGSTQSSSTQNEKLNGLSWQELQALSNQVQPGGEGGKKAMETYQAQKMLTLDRLKSLHQSLESKPNANVMADQPKMLKIELMPHQKHALAFLLWRENSKPAGGMLADDMGLGKTLTMISLILKTKEIAENEKDGNESDDDESSNDENKEDEWKHKRSREYYNGGTLVVCPASLINQWENEIIRHCRRDCLSVYVYHGTNREKKSRRLAKHDVVITTYNIVGIDQHEFNGIFGVRWLRIILDEAHVIRNYKAKSSMGVFALKGKRRWCLSGTPVQNKELDLFALLKFLRCSPFDDLVVFKKWIYNKTAGGQDRLNTIIQSIMLRRTKEELVNNGTVLSLPEKTIEEIDVKLSKDEMNIYQKVLLYSKTLFAQFLHQRAEKNAEYGGYIVDRNPKLLNNNPNPDYEKVHQKLIKMHGTEVKAHHILVLLLRLRQTCCHVALIKGMIENEDSAADGIEDADGNDIDLLEQLEKLDINDEESDILSTENENEGATSNSAACKILNPTNPIFNISQPSSKIKTVINKLKQTAIAKGDKAIIVSQWSSMLKIIEEHLVKEGIKCETLDGKVPVQKRMVLVDTFNSQSSKLQVLLLSLTAGGVGLNLVGANHLYLIDLHWNPQLEEQAQDRIYRFGQNKQVFIYKFVTPDTIEERIKRLQQNKLNMATSLLTGTKNAGGNKLSIEDLKMLFDMNG